MKGIHNATSLVEIPTGCGTYTQSCMKAAKAFQNPLYLTKIIDEADVKYTLRGIAMEPAGAEALHILIRMVRAWTYGKFTSICPESAYLALLGVVYFDLEAQYSEEKRTYVPPDAGMLILLLTTKLEHEMERFVTWEANALTLAN